MEQRKDFGRTMKPIYKTLIIISTVLILVGISAIYFYGPDESQEQLKEELQEQSEVDPELIENGMHVRTGLVAADGLQTVITNCTPCHSSKLIIQNRMGAEQWNATIRWMQKTQGLWDLGENQKVIVDYLVENYPPLEKGRRVPLTNIEWYALEE